MSKKQKKTDAPHPRQDGQGSRSPAGKPPVRAKAAQTNAAGQLGETNTELPEDDWSGRQLPTYD